MRLSTILNIAYGQRCVIGDINGDDTINIVDALLVARYYVGMNPPHFSIKCADVDCDGDVDILDALLVAQYYVGLLSHFDC